MRLTADYDGVGAMTETGRRKAVGVIRDERRPVILGTGWLGHYPLGIGYGEWARRVFDPRTGAWNRSAQARFSTHDGHAEPFVVDVPDGTWFQGWVE